MEDKEDILIVGSPTDQGKRIGDKCLIGSVAQLTATFKSPGAIGYNNAVAHVYVDGVYMGIADKLPYTAPGIGQEDPGQIFSFALLGNSLGEREIEFVIFNDDETASAKTTVSVEESVLTDNELFLTELYQGLYGRNPESDELGQFYGRLMDGTITRADVIEELSVVRNLSKPETLSLLKRPFTETGAKLRRWLMILIRLSWLPVRELMRFYPLPCGLMMAMFGPQRPLSQ